MTSGRPIKFPLLRRAARVRTLDSEREAVYLTRMVGLVFKIVVLLGVIGGGAYALVKTLMRRDNNLEALAAAQRDLVLLKERFDRGDVSASEYEARVAEVMAWAEKNNFPPLLAADVPPQDNV